MVNTSNAAPSAQPPPSVRPRARANENNNNNNNNGSSIMDKWMAMAAAILRILLWPVHRLSLVLFPAGELDGLSPAVTAKAAQQFASYLQTLQACKQPSSNSLDNHHHHPTSSGTSSDAAAAAARANHNISELWQAAGFAAAREQALQSQSLLLVYLHSPLHWQAEAVCRDVLLDDSFLQYLADPAVVAMGCSVHSAQGAQLQQAVQATALPCLVLLQPGNSNSGRGGGGGGDAGTSSSSSSTTVQLLFRAQGPKLLELVQLQHEQTAATSTAPSSTRRRSSNNNASTTTAISNAVEQRLIPYLQTALVRHQTVLAEQTARRLQRQEESDLRRQQDEEFAAALQADQERERQRAEQERLQAEEQAAAAAAEQEAAAVAERKVAAARAKLLPEPDVATAAAGTTSMIRFVLPTGAKLNRRFGADETIAALRAYLFLHFQNQPGVMEHIGLSTNFPRTTYNSAEDDLKTLREAGLVPQAVLMVQDLDA